MTFSALDLAFRAFAGLTVGLVFGSFVTMASYRLPRGLSIVAPPSACPRCGHRLGARDLVPVFSWLFQRGRCRYCAAPIPARYIWIELAIAVGFCLLSLFTNDLLLLAGLGLLFIAAATFFIIRIES